jgi:hypothetical protein
MQKISIAVLALIGAVSSVNINSESKYDSFAQTTASAAARANAGVRARWVELPDCQGFVQDGPTFSWKADAGEVIPLKADLSNAIIATCKGPHVINNPQPADPADPITTNIPVAQSQIYDPVVKTSIIIPDQEHQVSQLQHGVVNATDQTTGPTGDFYTNWKYTNGASQPYQASGASWDA